mmetsp:Transcript_13588/g.36385  ORF Transcript_13588/g.36385 Transcript_13588/m.36385 type:complete len:201 (-) Transcript_13588:458-1060(-)
MGKGHKGGRRHFTNPEELEQERRGMERGRGRGGNDDSASDDEEDVPKRSGNKMAQQSATVGELPPNSSDEEEEEEAKPKGKGKKKVQPGDLPPSDSEDDSDSDGSDDDSSSDDEPAPPPRRELTRREREALEAQRAEPDPEQVAAEMERLRIVREKRAAQAAARIAAEGFDRYAPPPGSAPQAYDPSIVKAPGGGGPPKA